MAIQFVYGRSHSGKTKYVLEKAQALHKENKPLVFVVPEQYTHTCEKRLISYLGYIDTQKADVVSFDKMCKKINSNYPNNKRHLGNIGKSLILSKILSEIQLSYYSNASKEPGFVEVCNSQISELKKYMISSEDLLTASEKVDNKSLSLKLKDISKVYSSYQKYLENNFQDAEDDIDTLAYNLENNNLFKGYTFFFDEFSSFTPQERNIISIISSLADNVYVTFCTDANKCRNSVFKVTEETSKLLLKDCEKRGVMHKESVILGSSFYDSDELSFLEENLYADFPSKYTENTSDIRLFTSENPYSEIELLASNIVKVIKEKNARFADISVVCPDIDSYGHILRSVFETYKIPYFIDEKVPVLKHSIISFVINILDIYNSNYSGESIVNYLKSGFLDSDRDAVCYTDNFIKATRASKNVWLSDDRFSSCINSYTDDATRIEKISEIRQKYILSLSKLHDTIKGRNTVKFITEKIYAYLLQIGFDKRISEFISEFKSEGKLGLASQYENVWNTLIEVFDVLVYIMGNDTVNLKEYTKFMTVGLEQQKTGIIPTSLDEVSVGDLLRTKSGRIKYQFVIGVTDSSFPSVSRTEGIITDREKQVLSDVSIELSAKSSERAYFDRFQIYSVFTHPDSLLYISYPASNTSFEAVRPAFVIHLLRKLFPLLPLEGSITGNDNIEINTSSQALEYLSLCASSLSRGESVNDFWKDIYKYFTDSGNTEKIEIINRFINAKQPVTRLSSDVLEYMYNDTIEASVSKMQRYNSCRYSYFLQYMLYLKELKEFGLESTDVGTLIHEIIENIFNSLKTSNQGFESTDKIYFENEVSQYLNDYIKGLTDLNPDITKREIFSVTRLKDSIVDSLLALRDHMINSEFVNMGCEIEFSDDNLGPIEFELPNGKTDKIKGKIDRADSFTNEDATYIRVVDYKTGNKTFNFTDVFYGLDVQLLVYLNALVDKTPNSHPAGALYFKILNPLERKDERISDEKAETIKYVTQPMEGVIAEDDKIISAFSPNSVKLSNKLSTKQFRILGDYINHIIITTATSISEGRIETNPYKTSVSSPCEYCPYKSICNVDCIKDFSPRELNSKKKSDVFEDMETIIGKRGDV